MQKKTAILKLQTEAGLLEGHSACADYLERSVETLLLHAAELDLHAQEALLAEVVPVFSEAENKKFLARPNSKKVYDVVAASKFKCSTWDRWHPKSSVQAMLGGLQIPTN